MRFIKFLKRLFRRFNVSVEAADSQGLKHRYPPTQVFVDGFIYQGQALHKMLSMLKITRQRCPAPMFTKAARECRVIEIDTARNQTRVRA